MPSPRALLGAAPAVIVVAGSYAMSRACLHDNAAREAAEQNMCVCEVIARPTAGDEERLHRVALKQEAIEDLLNGEITLAETVERFEMLSETPEAKANLRVAGRVDPRRSPAVNQVLAFARIRAAQEPRRFRAVLNWIEAEARSPAGPSRVSQ